MTLALVYTLYIVPVTKAREKSENVVSSADPTLSRGETVW